MPRHSSAHVRSSNQHAHATGSIDQTACCVADQVNVDRTVIFRKQRSAAMGTNGHIAQHDKAATVTITFPTVFLSCVGVPSCTTNRPAFVQCTRAHEQKTAR